MILIERAPYLRNVAGCADADVVLVKRADSYQPYATFIEDIEIQTRLWGQYFRDLTSAVHDFNERASEATIREPLDGELAPPDIQGGILLYRRLEGPLYPDVSVQLTDAVLDDELLLIEVTTKAMYQAGVDDGVLRLFYAQALKNRRDSHTGATFDDTLRTVLEYVTVTRP